MSHLATRVDDTTEDNMSKLTPKQQLYLEGRIQGLSVKHAARAAGYSSADSSRTYKNLEDHPRIKYLLLEANKQAFDKIVVTRSDVISGFMDAVNAAQSSTELVMAWRELGKIIGAYEPEVKIVKHMDVTAEKVRGMKDSDLLAMADMEDFNLPDIEDAEYYEIDEEDMEADMEEDFETEVLGLSTTPEAPELRPKGEELRSKDEALGAEEADTEADI